MTKKDPGVGPGATAPDGRHLEQEMTHSGRATASSSPIWGTSRSAGLSRARPLPAKDWGLPSAETGDRAGVAVMLIDVDLNGPRLGVVHGDPVGRRVLFHSAAGQRWRTCRRAAVSLVGAGSLGLRARGVSRGTQTLNDVFLIATAASGSLPDHDACDRERMAPARRAGAA
jgi:hypothetical protein